MDVVNLSFINRKKVLYKSGEITVFMTLIFLAMSAFMLAIIKSSKETAVKLRVETLTDISMRSAFYEYDKALYDKYGLIYVDTTYKGVEDGGDDSFTSHVEQYIDVNISAASSDVYGIELVSVDLIDTVYASDNNYESVKNQIRHYMIKNYGYTDTLSDEYFISQYIEIKMPDDFYETYFGCEDKYDLSDTVEYEDLFNSVLSEIKKDMCENVNSDFEFSNHLEGGVVSVLIRNKDGKEYVCNRASALLSFL